MNISILCSDPQHPIISHLKNWINEISKKNHSAMLLFDKSDLQEGDLLFLVSCSQMINENERSKYKATLVLHASDLPRGRGWSPHIWTIIKGGNEIVVSLLEANEPVDSGAIWLKTRFSLEGHELLDEINEKLFVAELQLMSQAVDQFYNIRPIAQTGEPDAYMNKRSPSDSELDPNKSIAEQFDLLRTIDSKRYPAFMIHRGNKYLITIEKANHEL